MVAHRNEARCLDGHLDREVAQVGTTLPGQLILATQHESLVTNRCARLKLLWLNTKTKAKANMPRSSWNLDVCFMFVRYAPWLSASISSDLCLAAGTNLWRSDYWYLQSRKVTDVNPTVCVYSLVRGLYGIRRARSPAILPGKFGGVHWLCYNKS